MARRKCRPRIGLNPIDIVQISLSRREARCEFIAFETDEYQVAIAWTSEASFEQKKAHEFLLAPTKDSQNALEFVVQWSAPAERSGDRDRGRTACLSISPRFEPRTR